MSAAAEWIGLLDSDDVSVSDRAAFEAWCAQSQTHRQTFERMRGFHDRLEHSDSSEREALQQLLDQPGRRSIRKTVLFGAGLIAAIGVAGVAVPFDSLLDRFPDHQTGRGQQQVLALGSGSSIVLDTDTAVRVNEGSGQDDVRLISGRVFAKVRDGRKRPFVVETPFGSAEAMGTAYSVEISNQTMVVEVAKSTVRVCPISGAARGCATLAPGDRALVRGDRVIKGTRVDPTVIGVWTSGWIEAVDEDLVSVLGRLNRYRVTPVGFDREALKGVRVSGSFPIKDQGAALRGIALSSGTIVTRSADGAITVKLDRTGSLAR
nr:FecR domain-containing protein [Novosphingobium sp. Rr 2-17]